MANALERFLNERSKVDIPSNYVAWVRMLAQELAIGVHWELWPGGFTRLWTRDGIQLDNDNLTEFGLRRWEIKDWANAIERLHGTGFVVNRPNQYLTIDKSAFDLLQEVTPYDVFISYRRKDSSALALLVLARLKEFSLVPFVDMALEAGGNWHADLEERIKDCDYFIILLGKETLSSPMTVKEIQWALQYEKTIIPLWHCGFDLKDEKCVETDKEVKVAIQQTNAIIVQDESASGYNTAIVELLNRFGVTP